MLNEKILKFESEFADYFNFRLIKTVKSTILDNELSEIIMLNDFVIISLLSKKNISCPFSIYYGIRKSVGYYSLLINNRAIIYNYEHFYCYDLFEKELVHFFSNEVRQEIFKDSKGNLIYADYFVKDYKNEHEFSFREYYNNKWTNIFGLKRTQKSTHYFEPWI